MDGGFDAAPASGLGSNGSGSMSADSMGGGMAGMGSDGGSSVMGSMSGMESMYDMNKYSKTRSYNLLKIIYACIRAAVSKSGSKNTLICDLSKNCKNDQSLKIQLYSYLVNALPLIPANLFQAYYAAINTPGGMFLAFAILHDLFSKKNRKEMRLKNIIDSYVESKKLDKCDITHIGFFSIKKGNPDYFVINRNCKKFKCTTKNGLCIFFLPKEVLSIDLWLTLSLDFDKYLLEIMIKYFKSIKPLYKNFVDMYDSLMSSSGSDGSDSSDDNGLDLSGFYTNLKFYSFFIISSCIPRLKNKDLAKVQDHIHQCFGRGNFSASEVLAECFNLMDKKM